MNDMQRLLIEVAELREVNRKLTCELAETKNKNVELTSKNEELQEEINDLYDELGEYQRKEATEKHCYQH